VKPPSWVNAHTIQPSPHQESGKQPILDKIHAQLIKFVFFGVVSNQRAAQLLLERRKTEFSVYSANVLLAQNIKKL
jgi:hypothetical protein